MSLSEVIKLTQQFSANNWGSPSMAKDKLCHTKIIVLKDKIAMIVEGWSAAVCNISIMTFLSLECHTVICFGSQHLGIIFDTNNWFLVFPSALGNNLISWLQWFWPRGFCPSVYRWNDRRIEDMAALLFIIVIVDYWFNCSIISCLLLSTA